jgi:uncharacterized protein YkwD
MLCATLDYPFHTSITMQLNFILCVLCAIGLTACGGGGGTTTTPTPSAATTANTPVVTSNPPSTTQTGTPSVSAPSQTSQASTVTAATSCNLPNFQTEVLRQVNAARAQARSCGAVAKPAVGAVAWSNTLFTAASGHSQDMALHNFFDHINLDGKTPGQRATSTGYNFAALGENIAAGQGTVSDVMAGWLASSGHCNNIMNGVYTDMAVACVTTGRLEYPTYWTMVLGKPL